MLRLNTACLLLAAPLVMASHSTVTSGALESETVVKTDAGYWLAVSADYDPTQQRRALGIADNAFRQVCSAVEPRVCANPAEYFITVRLFGDPGEGCSGTMNPARREAANLGNGELIQNAHFHCGPDDEAIVDSYSTQTRLEP